MTLAASQTVRSLVRNYPAAAGVFETLHIDYCCGGDQPLAEACRQLNLSPQAVLADLEAALRLPPIPEDCHWLTCPLSELAGHIAGTHHTLTRREVPVVAAWAEKVTLRHGHAHPELSQVRELVETLQNELLPHLLQEEEVVFPALEALEAAALRGDKRPACSGTLLPLIRRLLEEHDDAAELLRSLRKLARNYETPESACPTFRALYAGLKQLEQDLHRHIHLENNILFPRALELERGLRARLP